MNDSEKECFIEVEWSEGTSARWAVTEAQADEIGTMIENRIGPPDTIKA